jgi:hypothetical protein
MIRIIVSSNFIIDILYIKRVHHSGHTRMELELHEDSINKGWSIGRRSLFTRGFISYFNSICKRICFPEDLYQDNGVFIVALVVLDSYCSILSFSRQLSHLLS